MNKYISLLTVGVLAIAGLLIAGNVGKSQTINSQAAAAGIPTITSLSRNRFGVGKELVVFGTGFGKNFSFTNSVCFDSSYAGFCDRDKEYFKIINWDNQKITVKMVKEPYMWGVSGRLSIRTYKDQESNSIAFSIPPILNPVITKITFRSATQIYVYGSGFGSRKGGVCFEYENGASCEYKTDIVSWSKTFIVANGVPADATAVSVLVGGGANIESNIVPISR